MIKITTELKQNSGFTSKISVLEITSYTLNETVYLVQNPNMPTPISGNKNLMVQFSLYKSAADKANGASPYQAIDFPYSYQLSPGVEDVINETYLYAAVSHKLTEAGYVCEVM